MGREAAGEQKNRGEEQSGHDGGNKARLLRLDELEVLELHHHRRAGMDLQGQQAHAVTSNTGRLVSAAVPI